MLVIKIPLQHYFLNCFLSVNKQPASPAIPCSFGAKNEERESNGASERALVQFLARPKPKIPLLGLSSLAGYILRL